MTLPGETAKQFWSVPQGNPPPAFLTVPALPRTIGPDCKEGCPVTTGPRPIIWTILAPMLGLAVVSGCSGHYKELLRQNEEFRRELGHLKSATNSLTVYIEDLQNKLLLLEDQVETNHILLSRGTGGRSELPVVTLGPAGVQPQWGNPTARETASEPEEDEAMTMEDIPAVVFQRLDGGRVLDDTAASAPVSGPNPTPQPSASPPPTRPVFDSRPLELYKQGYSLLQQKDHAQAITRFQDFLDAYPNHDYADNAMYWMGEAYYDMKDYTNALACFERLVRLYPDENKVPDALLKRGLTLMNMGQNDLAMQALADLVKQYPSTSAAGIARDRMNTLR